MLFPSQSSRRRDSEDKEDQENHQEDEEQELGDGEGRPGDTAETQNSRNQSQNQKQHSQPKHRDHLKEAAFSNEGRGLGVPPWLEVEVARDRTPGQKVVQKMV
jgi:hypothetical protein